MPVPTKGKYTAKKEQAMPEGSYKLNCSDGNDDPFTKRVGSIFGCLDTLEQKHCEAVKNFRVIDDDVDDSIEAGCSNEGNTGRSFTGTKRKMKKPGFVENPCKWKKYSLKEDGSGNLSKQLSADQLNTKVAMDFMDDLKHRKEGDIETKEVRDPFVFKKPELPNKNATSTKGETKSLFGATHGGNARCMETFEFGQNIKNKKHEIAKENINCELTQNEVVLDLEDIENLDEGGKDDSSDIMHNQDTESKQFISKGKKKNRVIRKRVCEDDE